MTRTWNRRLATITAASAILIALSSGATHAQANTTPTGTMSILDTDVKLSGIMTSATIGSDGLPIIAYRVNVNDPNSPTGDRMNLRVAHCVDMACTFITTTDIDTGAYTGNWPSIKIGSDGLPLISYVAFRDKDGNFLHDLRTAHCNDITCTSATVTTLGTIGKVETKTSLTIGSDGLGLISYKHSKVTLNAPGDFNDQLMVAHCLNIACSSAKVSPGHIVRSDGGGMFGPGHAVIATGANGLGVIAYHVGGTQRELRVRVCADVDCTTNLTTTQQIVDKPANGSIAKVGTHASITIGVDGLPLIAYMGSAGLTVAHCTDPLCNQSTKVTVDTGTVGGTSIAIGSDGFGVISYLAPGNDLKVAHCANITCSATTKVTVDMFGDVGKFNSITIGADGLPLISYLGPGIVGPNALRVIHCGNLDCTAPIVAPFLVPHGSSSD